MKDDTVYLRHMLEMAEKALAKAGGKTRTMFDEDEDLRMVLAYLIQVIGEAASRVSEPTRVGYPEVAWAEIVGMRHRLVHDYMNVDYDIVWEVVVRKLPELVGQLRRVALPPGPA